MDSNPLLALIFLVFGEPLAMTVIYWAWMIIVIPLGLIFRDRRPPALPR